MGIYELAAIHLSNEPPAVDAAKIAIDAMSAIMAGLQGRLGQNENVLREALQQIQIAFVQISEQHTLREESEGDKRTNYQSKRNRTLLCIEWPNGRRSTSPHHGSRCPVNRMAYRVC